MGVNTPFRSSTCTINTPLPSRMKIKPTAELKILYSQQ
jgi:biotin synthase-related radical SAM superfamily protein